LNFFRQIKLAFFSSGQRIEDHFADVSKMVEIENGEKWQQYGAFGPRVCRKERSLFRHFHEIVNSPMKPDVAARISILAKRLRTPSFRECGPLLREAREQGLDYEAFLLLLLEQEVRQRDDKARQKRLRAARFPLAKSLDEFDMSRLANVSEASLWDLASVDFVDRRQNVILVGNPGTGKTHLAIGLGRRLCEKGFSVRFTQAASLATELSEAAEDKVLGRLLKTLERVDLLILDELSYVSFTKNQSELLFHALSARNEKGSVMITTNLEFSKWTELFPDPMLAAAMIDRITHRSHILDMNGASYRLAETKRRKAKGSGSI